MSRILFIKSIFFNFKTHILYISNLKRERDFYFIVDKFEHRNTQVLLVSNNKRPSQGDVIHHTVHQKDYKVQLD